MSAAADDSGITALPSSVRRALIAQRCMQRCDDIDRGLDAIGAAVREWLDAHDTLRRSVLVVDDTPTALVALVSILAPIGIPLHAVTTDASEALRSTLLLVGAAEVHVVPAMGDAARVWEETRSSVIVCDLHLGDGVTGMDVIAGVADRGVRCIIVSSCGPSSRDSVERAADRVHAEGIVRTNTGRWEESLRERVSDSVDTLTPRSLDA